MTREDITVQIMLGGRSSRMGQDKALVKLGGKTLLERAVERWKDYGSAIQLSVGEPSRAQMAPQGIPAVADIHPQCGPMGGLHAGLLACPTEYLLLVAVDSPFTTAQAADDLWMDGEEDCDAFVYVRDGRPEPLFALYRKSCLPEVERLLEEGMHKMGALLERVNTSRRAAADSCMFYNVNTPEELAEAENLLKNDC